MIALIYRLIPFLLPSLLAMACNTPLQSQKYFAQAVKNDPVMEPLHQTALYTVYFDHALQRCVLHSSYTWGESGGGTGGTGLGVSVFNCNPQALKAHADRLREQIKNGTDYFELPVPKVSQTRPTSQQSTTGLVQPKPRLSASPAPISQAPQKPTQSKEQAGPAAASPPPVSATVQPPAPAPRSAPSSSQGNSNVAPPVQTAPPAAEKKQNQGPKLLQPITMP